MRRTRVFIAIMITAMMITLAAPMAAYAWEHGSVIARCHFRIDGEIFVLRGTSELLCNGDYDYFASASDLELMFPDLKPLPEELIDTDELGRPGYSLREVCDYMGWGYTHVVESGVLYVDITTTAKPIAAPPIVAIPTASIVLVNGGNVAFDAYNINGNNYFKLRDLAFTLNGTAKQFAVGWDSADNAISLTSGQPYESVGGEMTGKGLGSKEAVPTASKIYMDGKEVQFTAYNIGGNNYFKLRDIGEAFDFGVDWDGAAQTIRIDTSKGYTPDGAQLPVVDPRAPVADESVRGKLASLEIVGYKLSPDFDPDVMVYFVIVPNNVTSVQVKFYTADMRASIKSTGGGDLAVGGNLVSVEVTAENGTVKTYTINVTRQEPKPEGPGDLSNANLKSLFLPDWSLRPGFEPDVVEYSITLGPDTPEVTVKCEAEDPKATITITGNTNIPNGKSQILIVVTAQDGTMKTYTINVIQQWLG